jgi:hypothetical protein
MQESEEERIRGESGYAKAGKAEKGGQKGRVA